MLKISLSSFSISVPLLFLIAMVVCWCSAKNLPALTQTIAIWRQGKMIGSLDNRQ